MITIFMNGVPIPGDLWKCILEFLDVRERIQALPLVCRDARVIVKEKNISEYFDPLILRLGSWWGYRMEKTIGDNLSTHIGILEFGTFYSCHDNTASPYVRINNLFYIDLKYMVSWNDVVTKWRIA